MADNLEIVDKNSATKTMAADEVAGVLYQVIKLALGPDGVAALLSGGAGSADAGTLRMILASDDPLSAIAAAGGDTVTCSIQRPANTTTYTAGAIWANATSGAVVSKFTNASRGAGKLGIIQDLTLLLPVAPGTMLQGELWFFDSLPTVINDNGAWSLSDTDLLKVIKMKPFAMATTGSSAGNSIAQIDEPFGFTTQGSADLYVMPRVTNAYLPSSAETLTMKAKVLRVN